MTLAVIDNRIYVETPEGTELNAELAGLVPRALAYTMDFFIRAAILIGASLLLTLLGDAGWGIFFVSYFLLEWFYPVFFDLFRQGQTIGKKSMGLRVVHDDLTPIGLSSSLIRNLLRVADFLPGFFMLAGISLLVTRQSQRLGDLAARTIVVYASETNAQIEQLPSETPLAPSFPMTEKQQQAVIAFAVNRSHLSAERQLEIAQILSPILPKNHQNTPVTYLRGLGKWLLGHSAVSAGHSKATSEHEAERI